MQLEQFKLSDDYFAMVRWWRAADPSGAVLYFHGIQSHGGWFEASGRALADVGYTVLMPDRRGSGENPPPRGHYESVEQCEADCKLLLDVLLSESRQKSAHLIGVSWGAKQVLLLAAKYPDLVRSVSFVGPGFFPRVLLDRAERFRIGLSIMNDPLAAVDIPLNDPSSLTGNVARFSFIEHDPLKLKQVTGSFLRVGRRLDRLQAKVAAGAYNGPVHLILGGRDKIINNEKTRKWLRTLPATDLQITEFPEGGHTLEFEANLGAFLESLVGWLNTR